MLETKKIVDATIVGIVIAEDVEEEEAEEIVKEMTKVVDKLLLLC